LSYKATTINKHLEIKLDDSSLKAYKIKEISARRPFIF